MDRAQRIEAAARALLEQVGDVAHADFEVADLRAALDAPQARTITPEQLAKLSAKIDSPLVRAERAAFDAAMAAPQAEPARQPALAGAVDDLKAQLAKTEDRWIESVKALLPHKPRGPITGGYIDTDVPPGRIHAAPPAAGRGWAGEQAGGGSGVMRYGSACSGIEAASVAWKSLGWECAFVSEIEPFPSRVLAHHYPDVPNLGDMTKITEADLDRCGPIDLLVGGTPCQSFSVAGLREGMADPRGGLALVFLELARRTRPVWVVWENVPGVLSADEGRAFGSFIGGLAELGYGFAYRVLDAQYFGLAQRRKRVFVVGCLGDWRRAAAVLFEPSCLRGDLAPSREAGAGVAETVKTCTCRSVGAEEAANGHLAVAHSLRADGFDASEDGTGRGTPLVAAPVTACYGKQADNSDSTPGRNGVLSAMHVRRLTPRECERLQGFPDHYTAIPGAKDSPRYRALGNSMAVPVMRWIGERIASVEAA